MSDGAGEGQRSDAEPELQRFEGQGRPIHDFFPDGMVIRIRLSPEYSTPPGWVPLWPSSDDTDALVPPPLLDELIAWGDEFNENFLYKKGWRSREIMDQWAAQAAHLAQELRSVLAGKAELEVDLWPLEPGLSGWDEPGTLT